MHNYTKNMKTLITTFFLAISLNVVSQEIDFTAKFDSILKEADLLYSYEKAVWHATDLFMDNKKMKKDFGGYVVYHTNDTVFVAVHNSNQDKILARYSFRTTDLVTPFETMMKGTPLSAKEQLLMDTKIKIIKQLSEPKYEVTIPKDFTPNFVLVAAESGFKAYIIMGTNQKGIIPFGNDYLFKTDSEGNISTWQKFHSRMIPVNFDDSKLGKIVSCTHSHLRTTPYITATDICTFRLYAPFSEIRSFSVYSPALSKTMTYWLEDNRIEISE